MIPNRSSHPRCAVITAGAATLLLSACGPAGDRDVAGGPCAEPTAARLGRAGVERYVAERDPKPVRFLNPISSDSALPESSMSYLNASGPTYLFPPNLEQQATVRAKLADVGGWPTLLIFYHGVERVSDSEAEIRFSGQYVGGENEGEATPREAVRFVCAGGEWVLPAAAAADTTVTPPQRGA